MKTVPWITAVSTLTLVVAASVSTAAPADAPAAPAAAPVPAYLDSFPNFNAALSTQLPGDVDVAIKKRLEAAKKFPEVQRLFDLWSWQAFITLNWPTNNSGQFAPKLDDTAFGPPKWTSWYESTDIYRQDGGVPAPCSRPPAAMALSLTRENALPVARDLKAFDLPQGFDKRKVRLLGNISAVGEASPATPAKAKQKPEPLSDILQAFTAPMIDQNGNYVFYEIQLDPNEVGYICTNKLYNINGQVAFTHGNPNTKVDMPRGMDGKDGSGSWELKFAWRVLTKSDDRSRFLWLDAIVPPVGGKCPDRQAAQKDQCAVQVGLVGMHIGHKSVSSPQWIWSTFEQVDNLSVDNVAHPALKPSFFDPNCPICVPNQPPAQQGDSWATTPPTQAWRAIPIPADKVALNNEAQAALGKTDSALRFYQLIDTQWPTDPSAKPTNPATGLAGAIENKPGGNPTPVFLTNITMETYFQVGVQPACQQEEGQKNCPPGQWLTANQTKATPDDSTSVFASESCMGCHSSAGLFITPTKTSGQLSGDFSWLFSQKAKLAPTSK